MKRAPLSQRVLEPALASTDVATEVKSTIANSLRWLAHFKRVGDLIAYMDRFKGGADTTVYKSLKSAGLLTFEDIRSEFKMLFGPWQSDRTRLDDFVVGQRYSSFDIVIFAEVYDNRSGGILSIGVVGNHKAVFVKATLKGGKYENKWIEAGSRLKYYLKRRRDNFDENYVENRAIIQYPNIPVYVFVRDVPEGPFLLAGTFRNKEVRQEPGGAKWFDLVKITAEGEASYAPISLEQDLARRVAESLETPRESRLRRLQGPPTKPKEVSVVGRAFIRNADVIVEVLARADGVCECCGEPAPFTRLSDHTPYLEVHHKVPLARGGDDTVQNAVALCANCHRREHYGPAKWPFVSS